MDNISQNTPAHQVVSKETVPLINKTRSRGLLLGFAVFHFCFVIVVGFFAKFILFFLFKGVGDVGLHQGS